MRIKKARQILKTFAEDTRLRIINLLNNREITVKSYVMFLIKISLTFQSIFRVLG
ncbi:MAG: hypothetical protein ABH952_01000 [Candidatus Omnitrophota bacterium]